MKVLILAPNIDIVGGANVLVFKVARFLESKGDDVQIWSNLLHPKHHFRESEFEIRSLGPKFSDQIAIKKMFGIMSYLAIPKEVSIFDVVFCHNFPSYFSTLSFNFHGTSTVWQCNEPSIILYPLSHVGSIGSQYRGPYFAPILYALRKVDKLAVNRITKISVLSEFTKDRVRLFYNRDSEIIRIGTDTNRFNPSLDGSSIRELYRISDRPCILTVGNMAKRVDLVIKALSFVRKIIPDVVYMIVGPCDPVTKLKLNNLIRSLGLESNIILTGEKLKQGSDLLPYFYASCDIFVFPEQYWSWSMVTIEAMATGKPAIVPDVSGISEIILNEVNGIKIPIQNTKVLAKTIITLLKNEKMRQNMGSLAREYVEKHLEVGQYLSKTRDLLQKTRNLQIPQGES